MLGFDANKVLLNARGASTEALLDRVTVYRDGMEPEALAIIERELRSRGVSAADVAAHGEKAGEVLRDANGLALRCSYCESPAVTAAWGMHRVFGLPLLPRRLRYCAKHGEPGA
jgi:hypothetical protein